MVLLIIFAIVSLIKHANQLQDIIHTCAYDCFCLTGAALISPVRSDRRFRYPRGCQMMPYQSKPIIWLISQQQSAPGTCDAAFISEWMPR